MTRETALCMILDYQKLVVSQKFIGTEVLSTIYDRFPTEGSTNKAMRWLGFCQGTLLAMGVFSLEEIKTHSKNGEVTI